MLMNIITYFLYMVTFVLFPTYIGFRTILTQKNLITINAAYLESKEIFLRGMSMYQPKFKYEYQGKEYVALSEQYIGNQNEFIQNDSYTIYVNLKYPNECVLGKTPFRGYIGIIIGIIFLFIFVIIQGGNL